MSTYAKIVNGELIEIGPRPEWYVSGDPVSDEVLRAGGFEVDSNGIPIEDINGEFVLATGRDGWIPVIQQDMVAFNSLFYDLSWDNQDQWVVEETKVIKTYTITERPLDTIKDVSMREINKMAEGCRSAFITMGSIGVALEYIETKNEVERWLEDLSPELSNYPMINAEYKALSIASVVTPEDVVDEISYEINLWKIGSSAIKEVRRSGLVGVEISLDKERISDILDWCKIAFAEITSDGNFVTEFPTPTP